MTSTERARFAARIGRALDGAVIRLKNASQTYVATFLRQPELAKKNPKRIFLGAQDGGSFEKVFSAELTAESFVAAHRLAACVDDFIRQFMTRKRRRNRVEDWKADYSSVLGPSVIDQFGEVVDQVVPQSAIFLSALAFEEWVRLRDRAIADLVVGLEGDPTLLQRLLLVILRYGTDQPPRLA